MRAVLISPLLNTTVLGAVATGSMKAQLALIAAGQKSQGVARLRKGLTLMSDQKRAEKLITENLEPNS